MAAAELGISISTFRRATVGGLGLVRRGKRGRGCAALYDTAVIRAALAEQPPEVTAQLHLGALAATLPAALEDEFMWIGRMGSELTALGVPPHRQRDLLRYIAQRVLNRANSHLSRK